MQPSSCMAKLKSKLPLATIHLNLNLKKPACNFSSTCIPKQCCTQIGCLVPQVVVDVYIVPLCLRNFLYSNIVDGNALSYTFGCEVCGIEHGWPALMVVELNLGNYISFNC